VWVLDYRGFVAIAGFTWPFLAGNYLPLPALPDWAYHLLLVLPFAGLIQTPASVFLEKPDMVRALLLQLAWAIALLMAGRLVMARAERRLVVQAGCSSRPVRLRAARWWHWPAGVGAWPRTWRSCAAAGGRRRPTRRRF
jgi:hypothetical protein